MEMYEMLEHNIKGLFLREPARDKKRDGTINKIRRLQSFPHKFVVTFT